VQLKSGGYIVINPTEALVSIDINSGRSTREHNIEQTALSTNLEAAQEIARQLRLRDMAGLIVIDFIDMENHSNNRKVEKAMKEALKNDRARIQVGRISGFGLFEMSRQRLRTGVLEASTRMCPHCEGSGFIRTASSSGLQALRLLEEEAARGRGSRLILRASQEAALYVLNRKRAELADIEDRYGVVIEVLSDGQPEGARMTVEASGPPPSHAPRLPAQIQPEPDDDIVDEMEEEEEEVEAAEATERGEGEGGERRRRRRRRRRGGRREEGAEASAEGEGEEPGEAEAAPATETAGEEGGEERRRGRRGRRGGRRRNRGGNGEAPLTEAADGADAEAQPEPTPVEEPVAEIAPAVEEKPRRRRSRKAAEPVASEPAEAPAAPAPEPVAEAPAKPKRSRKKAAEPATAEPAPVAEAPVAPEAAPAPARRRRATKAAAAAEVAPEPALVDGGDSAAEAVAETMGESEGEAGTPRRGWWQRTFGA
jgi:ribonuclease E